MEDEILKHSLKVYNEMKNHEHSVWEKVKEIIVEIFIIVFAVTLSIWLHGRDEHNQEQKEVKEFLIDLKEDLSQDIKSMHDTRDSVTKKNNEYYSFLEASQNAGDTIKKGSSIYFTTAIVTTKISDGDYEGFKSSGKIGYIENKELKQSILKYYQETVPSISELEKASTAQILKIIDYVIDNVSENQSLFQNNKLKLLLKFYVDESETIKSQYNDAIKQANNIISEIDKTYKK